MFFSSIRTTLVVMTTLAIIGSTYAVLHLSLNEHRHLYKESAINDLNGNTENLANDLVPIMANNPDTFALTTILLRLDNYEHVKYAFIYDDKKLLLQEYFGKNITLKEARIIPDLVRYLTPSQTGVLNLGDELVSIKLIGDERLPLGYLATVVDLAAPLAESTNNLYLQVLPYTLAIVLIVIGLSLFLHHKMLFPLTQLSNFVTQVTNTRDYTLRPKNEGKMEVAHLSQNINDMMQTINHEMDKNDEKTHQLVQQQTEMEQLANFDALTRLINRQYFNRLLQQHLIDARGSGKDIIVLFIDLDGFKNVNDTLGHDTGDKLLVRVSQILTSIVTPFDLVSRFGGDEFTILLTENATDEAATSLADAIIRQFKHPITMDNWDLSIGASIGIAKASDCNYVQADLIINADIAMYHSKGMGRGVQSMFEPWMHQEAQRKMQIANSIDSALHNQEFALHYQAKVSPDKKVIGFEALVRWNHPELGLIPPFEFISIAEKSGRIVDITKWVIKQVGIDGKQLIAMTNNDVKISINLSALDLIDKNLFGFIDKVTETYGVNLENIEFEITESSYLESFELTNPFFDYIRRSGCSVALDDFGTGYSSFSYLAQLPIDTVKIDKQFIDKIGQSDRDNLITKTIIDMAKHLNLNVCAEGVENWEQFMFLDYNNCDQIQGYLFSQPVPISDLQAHITRIESKQTVLLDTVNKKH